MHISVFCGASLPTMSIYDNVLSGFPLNDIKLSKAEKDTTVEHCLKSVALWDEVKDVLETMFANPIDERTKAYLTGKMG